MRLWLIVAVAVTAEGKDMLIALEGQRRAELV